MLAATYHQVWWPDTSAVKYDGDQLAAWDEATGNYLELATGEVLPTWDQTLDAIGDEPHHVVRFGDRFDAKGVLAGSKDTARCIGYLTKYLTKQVGHCHDADHLGYAGRRVLVSRKWSGKTLADHRADRQQWLLSALGVSATDPARDAWELVAPRDPDHMDHARRLMHAIADRARWQAGPVNLIWDLAHIP